MGFDVDPSFDIITVAVHEIDSPSNFPRELGAESIGVRGVNYHHCADTCKQLIDIGN